MEGRPVRAGEVDANEVPDYRGMLDLTGQTHVVLGGGFGIGQQTAHALAALGAHVVVVDRDPERAGKVAADVRGSAWSGDVTDRGAVAELFDTVTADRGRLDGVIDIIGLARAKPLGDFTDEDWLWHHEIVLKHAVLALQHASAYWRATGTAGSVTLVASTAGLDSAPGQAAYGANKAAMMSLVRTAAVELGPHGIRVNAVAPGIVRTPRAQANPRWTDELLAENEARTPLRKLASTPDIAAALLFLASPLAAHVTGQTLVVDGGAGVVYNVVSPV